MSREDLVSAVAESLGGNRGAALVLAANPGVSASLTQLGLSNRIAYLRARIESERKTRRAAIDTLRMLEDEPDAAVREAQNAAWSALLGACDKRIAEDECLLSDAEARYAVTCPAAPWTNGEKGAKQ